MSRTLPAVYAKGLTSLSAPSTPLIKPTGAARQSLQHQKHTLSSSVRCLPSAASTLKVSAAARPTSRQAESVAKHIERVRQASKAPPVAVQRRSAPSPTLSGRSSLRSRGLLSSQTAPTISAREVVNPAVEQVAEALSHLTLSLPASHPVLPGSRIPRRVAQKQTPTTTGALKSCLVKKVVRSRKPRGATTRRPVKRVHFYGSANCTYPMVQIYPIEPIENKEKQPPSFLRESKLAPAGWIRDDDPPEGASKSGVIGEDLIRCPACLDVAHRGGINLPSDFGYEEIGDALPRKVPWLHPPLCRCSGCAYQPWFLDFARKGFRFLTELDFRGSVFDNSFSDSLSGKPEIFIPQSDIDDCAFDNSDNVSSACDSATFIPQSDMDDCASDNSDDVPFVLDPEPLGREEEEEAVGRVNESLASSVTTEVIDCTGSDFGLSAVSKPGAGDDSAGKVTESLASNEATGVTDCIGSGFNLSAGSYDFDNDPDIF